MKDEIRIASIGNVDSAKSTTISVIANNILDDGRGKARQKILRHKHEEETGRTSSITQYYIETPNKIIGFFDLAGHERYLKTTMCGLNGCYIDYAMITIGVDRGIVGMAKEHLAIAVALKIPIFVVITKIDVAIEEKYNKIIESLKNIFKHPIAGNKEIKLVDDTNITDIISKFSDKSPFTPVFKISNVNGYNVQNLRQFVNSLPKYNNLGNDNDNNPIFRIDDKFKIKGIGVVISGILQQGTIKKDDKLFIGPFNGKFKEVLIRSIHDNFKTNIDCLTANQGGCFNIKLVNSKKDILDFRAIKFGTILIKQPYCIKKFDADIQILHHPTTIKLNYQPFIHCGSVRQSAKICNMNKELMRTGDKATVTFEFMFRPEYIEIDSDIIFREGKTKGVGKVLRIHKH